MSGRIFENQCAEVRINGDDDSPCGNGDLKQRRIAGIRAQIPYMNHIVTLSDEPDGQLPPRATVDQEFHVPTRIWSKLSLAITLCA